MPKTKWYQLEIDTTHHWDQDWLDQIAKKYGTPPVIKTLVVATPDIREHLCSAIANTWLTPMAVYLANGDQFEDDIAEDIDTAITESADWQGWYQKWLIWHQYVPEGWVAGDIINHADVEYLGAQDLPDYDDHVLRLMHLHEHDFTD